MPLLLIIAATSCTFSLLVSTTNMSLSAEESAQSYETFNGIVPW